MQEFVWPRQAAPTCAASWSAARWSRRCAGRRRRAISVPTCIAAAARRRSRPAHRAGSGGARGRRHRPGRGRCDLIRSKRGPLVLEINSSPGLEGIDYRHRRRHRPRDHRALGRLRPHPASRAGAEAAPPEPAQRRRWRLCQNRASAARNRNPWPAVCLGIPRSQPMRILVIEDNQDIAASLGDYLEERGHRRLRRRRRDRPAPRGGERFRRAIVLDLNLPGMDGLEVCRKLRNDARKQTPVLMLTARDTLENKLAGLRFGRRRLPDQAVRAAGSRGAAERAVAPGQRPADARARRRRPRGQPRHAGSAAAGQAAAALNPTALKILQALDGSLARGGDAAGPRDPRVWGGTAGFRIRCACIHGLRAVVDKPFGVPLIQTRHGIGYRIAAPRCQRLTTRPGASRVTAGGCAPHHPVLLCSAWP